MVSELSATGAVPSSVVAAAVSGDSVAFARIVGAHHNDMARVCRVVCGDVELAQEAAQAAWPIAWRRLHTLRDPDKLRPWLISIAVNEGRKLVRRRHLDRIVELDVADVSSDLHDPATRAADTDLLEAIKSLPPDDRALLALRFVAGFDASEIAPALGISPSGVRSRLSRLVERLRKEVGDG
jgi:RNA polymerase sigma-70 factor (ECF subfamily)